MPRISWQAVIRWSLACAVTFRVRGAAADPNPIVSVRVEGTSAPFGLSLAHAEASAAEIFRRAGVTLVWMGDEPVAANRTLTVILTTSRLAPAGLGAEAMGVAPKPGSTAYVFVDRVAGFAASRGLPASSVLACALAHEIGHLLLPPNAHDAGGIMRAAWRPALFPPHRPGLAGFEPAQARLMRLRARGQ